MDFSQADFLRTDPEDNGLSPKDALYARQVNVLRNFVRTGAITRAQYEYSLNELTQKMYPSGEGVPPLT